ncbi:transcription initiation factor IIA subunit 1-like [Tropilaelaps mercedesae]|uniref:Transcription initiation factor IIA subunit 1-like n=1 Tax=Tropilaelaps mercedesae TaxID=418985 RepID=A0A1V9XVF1_9ACAR|nr:transcription initiation factor IIA subunit 1-like [Tropilaelaps mercedesae]
MDDVIEAISKEGLDVGVDDQALAELRRLWLAKLSQSGALETEHPYCLRIHPAVQAHSQFSVNAPNGNYPVDALGAERTTETVTVKHDIPRIIMHANTEGALVTGSDIVPCNVAAQLLRSGEGPLNLEDFSNCAGRLAKLTRKTQYRSTVKRTAAVRDEESRLTLNKAGCSGTNRILPGQTDGAFMGPGSDIESSSDENDSFIADGGSDTQVGSPSSEGSREPQDPDEVLNSGDDEDDAAGENERLDDIENIVVCQYAKVHRKGAHWKVRLTQGIMNIDGKDHVFSRMDGEADW